MHTAGQDDRQRLARDASLRNLVHIVQAEWDLVLLLVIEVVPRLHVIEEVMSNRGVEGHGERVLQHLRYRSPRYVLVLPVSDGYGLQEGVVDRLVLTELFRRVDEPRDVSLGIGLQLVDVFN